MSPPSLEPFVHPSNLLADETPQPSDPALRWWILHTWPRSEKVLARQLLRDKIPFVLPVRRREGSRNGRLRRSAIPCFPGYLFVWGGQEELCRRFAQAHRMATLLPVTDQLQLHTDLRGVYALMRCGAPLLVEERFEPGTPAEVTAGPLAGLVGKVLRRGRRFRFVLMVRVLLRGLSVEIERGDFHYLRLAGSGESARLRA
jgi:transcriptional antiterminator RfaH